MKLNLIGYSVHEGYAAPTIVSALSIIANSTAQFEFMILDLGIAPVTKRRMKEALQPHPVHFVNLPSDAGLSKLALSDRVHATRLGVEMYGKLFLPEIAARYFKQDRLLYLDSDTLVVGDLAPLFDTSFGESAIVGTLCFTQPTFGSAEGVPDYEALGFTSDTPALDSGVMLINIRKFCTQTIGRRAVEYARSHNNLPLGDLTAVDAVVGSDWVKVDHRWNFQVFDQLRDSYVGRVPVLYHFSGRHKPFLLGSKFTDAQILYEAYQREALAIGCPVFIDTSTIYIGIEDEREHLNES